MAGSSFDFDTAKSVLSDFGSAASLFGSAAGSAASAEGYRAEARAYSAAAIISGTNAQLTAGSTRLQQQRADRDLFKVLGAAKADIAGAGLTEAGSALDIIRGSAAEGALQKQVIGTQGTISENAYLQQQAAYQGQAEAASANAAAAAAGSKTSKVGGVLKVVGAIAGIAKLFCWVAREVYGEHDPRWLEFRDWMIFFAPNWFYRLYLACGEDFAAYIHTRPVLKFFVRCAMSLTLTISAARCRLAGEHTVHG